jgi:DNA invertase Pin-like site-specific DNA recombinase
MERMEQYARLNDHELVPIRPDDYDLGVSGSVPPWERPGLGKWLTDERIGEWDGLIVAKLDRLTRSLLDFERLVKWLQERGKVLICIDPAIDLTSPAGRAFAQVIVVFAEFERATIRQRTKEGHDKLIKDRKYTGGQLSFGYMAVKAAKNWEVVPDPDYAPVVAEMCERYVRYESFGSIAKWLNESGVPTGLDAMRKRSGKPMRGTKWTAASVRIVLSGPGILGVATKRDGIEPLRDDDGEIIYQAEPLVGRETWEKVQARIRANPANVKVNTSPLLRVVFCSCGAPMYSTTTRKTERGHLYEYRYYDCHGSKGYDRDATCTAKRMKAEPLENAVFGALLDLVGSYELTERKLVEGRNYAEDIARMKDRLSHLSGEIEMGEALGDDVSELAAKRDRARTELRRLVALEPEPARVETVRTGKKFRQHWESLGTVQRNEFLRSAGVTAVASKDTLPPFPSTEGPMTPLDIPRAAIVTEDGLNVVIDLGNLRDMLARADEL